MIEIAPSQIYTIRDVAEYFKCSTRKVHRLVATGELRGFKIGNQRRFRGDEILRFIEGRGSAAPVPERAPAVQPDRLYSLREVATILQIPTHEVAHWLRAGRLPGFRVGMEWRCWGRDLLKLAASSNGEIPRAPEPLQPPLEPDEEGEPTVDSAPAAGAPLGQPGDAVESAA